MSLSGKIERRTRTIDVAWKLCCVIGALLAIVSFTPLVIENEPYSLSVMGIPYTLTAGIFVSLGFILLTGVAAFIVLLRERGRNTADEP